MSKEPDWRKAYVESAEKWKEMGGLGGTEPIPGTGLLLSQPTSLSLLPLDAFVPFLLTRRPDSEG